MLSHVDLSPFKGKRVGVLLGGDTDERDVSLNTGRAFVNALKASGYDVAQYDLPADLSRLMDERPAAVIIGLHGGSGENGEIQGFLQMLGIPYTGSGVMASAIAMDKARTKALLRAQGVPTPTGTYLGAAEFDADAGQDYLRTVALPCVVKVNDAGSSVGVYLCDDPDSFVAACKSVAVHLTEEPTSGVLFEDVVRGPEYSVGFFDDVFMGAIKISPAAQFYDYEAKYESDTTEYDFVEDAGLLVKLETLGRATYRALGCRGVARVDLIGNSEELCVLEVNTIPGMTATSLIPKMASRHGIEFNRFTEMMLACARV